MMRTRRQGVIFSGLAFVGLITGALGLVVAVSCQSSSTRSTQAGGIQGRLAAELAESGIDECMAGFSRLIGARIGGDVRGTFLAGAVGGLVNPSLLGPAGGFSFNPERTGKLIRDNKLGIQLSMVAVRPLYYSTVHNYGEVDLTCCGSFKLMGNRQIFRRVTSRHYFQLDTDGQTFEVNPVSIQVIVDRSRDE